MAVNGNEPISAGNIKDLVDANAIISGNMIATLDDMTSYFEHFVFAVTSGASGFVISEQNCYAETDSVNIEVLFSESPEIYAGQSIESVIKVPSEFSPPNKTAVSSVWYEGTKPISQYSGKNTYTENGKFMPKHDWDGKNLRLYKIAASYISDWRSGTPLKDKVITIETLAKMLNK